MVTDPIYLKNWELFLDPTSKLSTLLLIWISNVQISNYVFSFYRVTDSTYLFKNYLYKRPARAAETNEIQVLQRSGICSLNVLIPVTPALPSLLIGVITQNPKN